MNAQEIRTELVAILQRVSVLIEAIDAQATLKHAWDTYPVDGKCWCCWEYGGVYVGWQDDQLTAQACESCRAHYGAMPGPIHGR